MKLISYCNRLIEYSFYSLFLFVPLVFSSAPSELFELPKMFLTFGITIIIGTSWIAKIVLQKRIHIQRTPLDIPILLFLVSQIISTIFSLDPHVSLWGYYSRFNGGLLSMIAYIFLYYAFVSNLESKHVIKLIKVSLLSGLLVALWGLPSHFGYDPTCLIFRGSLDTACWTDAFKPTIRIFSTLGQPAWMAAYMGVLIPLAAAFSLLNFTEEKWKMENGKWKIMFYAILAFLFYACLTYTDTRGGFIGFWIANILFWGVLLFLSFRAKRSEAEESQSSKASIKRSLQSPFGSVETTMRYFLIFNLSFLIFNFFAGLPISQISKFTLPEITKKIHPASHEIEPKPAAGELGGTDSGKIRLLVWKGAVDAWIAYPITGTGVETFAFAYYKYRPIEHNLTSEWDYLYNKAHNEYLNYLATTGVLGLGSYLLIIITFLYLGFRKLKTQNSKIEKLENSLEIGPASPAGRNWKLEIGLIAGYISILISNFFGFSVVIINLYFFLIPALVFILGDFLNSEKAILFPAHESGIKNYELRENRKITLSQWFLLVPLILTSCVLILNLTSYWFADINYATGSNLDKAGSYQEALKPLQDAVGLIPNEPVYKDELSVNLGTLASALYLQKDASSGAQLAHDATTLSDQVVNAHPNDIVYWKNRVRLFYTLAQGDQANEKVYFDKALDSITKARELAPNDAKISYNYGVLAGQTEGPKKGIEILEQTIKLKPDYRDAYFALGLFYHELAVDKNGTITDSSMQQKAIQQYEFILKNIDPTDKQVKESLNNWKK